MNNLNISKNVLIKLAEKPGGGMADAPHLAIPPYLTPSDVIFGGIIYKAERGISVSIDRINLFLD